MKSKKPKATLTDDGKEGDEGDLTTSSQEEARLIIFERMANQSPLKSGPSTVNGGGSTYESPLIKVNNLAALEPTSSMKKHLVPPLNFEKVYEQ